MKNKLNIALSILALIFFSCETKSQEVQQATKTTAAENINGVWESIGYGRILEITDTTIYMYDINKVSCIPSDEVPRTYAENIMGFSMNNKNILTIQMEINSYEFTRLPKLPDLCTSITKEQKEDPLHNFESLWYTFQEQYSYFKERNIDWNAMKAKYQKQISSETTPLELYLILDEMLEELNDGHVGIPVPDELEEAYEAYKKEKNKTAKKTARAPIDIDEVTGDLMKQYVANVNDYHYGIVRWGTINEDIAMIQVNGMMIMANYDLPLDDEEKAQEVYEMQSEESAHYAKDEIEGARFIMDSIIRNIKNTKACILDLRFNGGGHDEVALEILSHFTNKELEVFSKKAFVSEGKFTKPNIISIQPAKEIYKGQLYILTSHLSASATEILVLSSLVATPEAIRIGSNTEGIFSDILDKTLPNGWEYGLSNEIYLDTKGVNYENIGIPPHHAIPYEKSGYKFFTQIKEQEKDEAIEKVLSFY